MLKTYWGILVLYELLCIEQVSYISARVTVLAYTIVNTCFFSLPPLQIHKSHLCLQVLLFFTEQEKVTDAFLLISLQSCHVSKATFMP